MTFVFFLFVILFLLHSQNLLLSLILLEVLSFFALYFLSSGLTSSLFSDFMLLSLFSLFVIEGVIALSGLITLVCFTGSDYVSSSSFLNL